MALHYLDTSAIVKLYVPEPGSTWLATLITSGVVSISLLSIVEVASALSRRLYEGSLRREQRELLYRRFLADTQDFLVMPLDGAVVSDAAAMLNQSPPPPRLRSLDALHLASAREAFARESRSQAAAVGSFISADRTLLAAAAWAGLSIANPEDHA